MGGDAKHLFVGKRESQAPFTRKIEAGAGRGGILFAAAAAAAAAAASAATVSVPFRLGSDPANSAA